MSAGLTADQVRGKLRMLGLRRKSHARDGAQLAQETSEALVEARGKVRMTEAASLVGVSRSTAYELRDRRGDDDVDGGAT